MQTPLILSLLVTLSTGVKLPPNFRKCTYGKSDLDECLAKAVNAGSRLLTQPIKSIGLPNLAPLDIKSFGIGSGTGPVQVQQNFEDAKMYGLNEPHMSQVSFSLENMTMKLIGLFPNLEIQARYHLNGKVMFMPMEGEGNATLIIKNLTTVVYFPLEKIHKKGSTYLHITSEANITLPKLDLLYMNFENLYKGNTELGDTLNKVLNENWIPIFDDVRSGYEQLFTGIITNIFNSFFSRVPLPEMMDNIDPKLL